jgi:hypothetical protein
MTTVAFIWSKKDKHFLGISVSSNGEGEFCTTVAASLCSYNTPHAFPSAEKAKRCLSEDIPWYNSGPESPMREDYRLENCVVVEVVLHDPPEK